MYLCYVDESGDPGFNSHVNHFALSAFIVRDTVWNDVLDQLITLRRTLKQQFGFPMRAELKGAALINPRNLPQQRRGVYTQIGRRNKRVALYRHYMQGLWAIHAQYPYTYTFSVYVDKAAVLNTYHTHHDILSLAWERLFDRFNTFLLRTAGGETGIIFPDETENRKVRALLRRLRHYNPIRRGGVYHQSPIQWIIEDPHFVDSQHSYFIQTADMIAHAVYRFKNPGYKPARYNLHQLYTYLKPPLAGVYPMVIRAVTRRNLDGIVTVP